jgi:nucleotide-binding universal stress UspA family protein
MSESTNAGGGLAQKILVGTDGSDTASIAVRRAASIAAVNGAELVIVSAYSSRPPGKLGSGIGSSDAAWAATAEAAATEHVNRAVQLAKGVGAGAVSGNAVAGDPAEVLIGEAEKRGIDLIVVGSKGMQTSSRFFLGSVPNNVSHHTPCDLLIVRTTK